MNKSSSDNQLLTDDGEDLKPMKTRVTKTKALEQLRDRVCLVERDKALVLAITKLNRIR